MLSLIAICAAASGKYNGTMTAGVSGASTGYLASSYGSVSPSSLTDGKSLTIISDDSFNGNCAVRVSGFSSDPGAGYINYVAANGVSKLRTDASYSYSGGAATWVWTGSFGFTNGGTYPVVIA